MSIVPQRLGKYELRERVGRGIVGELWKGYDLQYQRDVAVKVVYTDLQSDPNFIQQFTSEGPRITSLHHDNIVPVHDIAITHQGQSTNTIAYIVSEYIVGQTLSQYSATVNTKGMLLSLPDIVYLFTSLGIAIDYAHRRGVIHGNIKPGNILLDQHHIEHMVAGEPMLTDFGLPLLLGDAVIFDTPQYISPEQAKGDAPNNRSDIYALGVILYELCTGIRPFRDESSVAVMMQHISTLPTPPILINPQLPPALSQVILRAMAKDTAARYAMASLLATAIADACSIRSTIPIAYAPVAEEENAYHVANGQFSSFLGVSQPISSTPSTATQKPSQPMPRIFMNPRIPSTAMPSPVPVQPTSASSSSSGKQRSVSLPPTPVMKKIVTPFPGSVSETNKISQPTRTTHPPEKPGVSQQGQPSIISQAYTPFESSPALPGTAFARTKAPKRSRMTDIPMYTVLAIVALVLLIATGVIGSFLLNSKGSVNNAVVGHVFFQDDALGHDDTLRLDMQSIAAPPQNKEYQVWLQEMGQHSLRLGALVLNNDTAMLQYTGTTQHIDLLSLAQGVVVTAENVGSNPYAPTGVVVYKATFDTAALRYIKNILYQTPNFPSHNGVVIGMLETIKSINDKAGSLVDSIQGTGDLALAKRQATRILELIDGTKYARSSGDLLKGMPSEVDAQVGLLSSPTQPGYIDTLTTQLDKLQQTPGINAALQQHIQNVKSAIADLLDWVQKLRSYDVPLVQAANIGYPALANNALQVKQIASDSYTGRTIPPDNGPRPTLGSAGAYQAFVECQYLATLDIKKV